GTVTLYSLTPVELAGRVFKPIPGTEPYVTEGGQEVVSQKSDGSAFVAETSTTMTVLRKVIEDFLALLPNMAEKDKAITELLVKGKIVKSAEELKRVKLPRKVHQYAQHVSQSLPVGAPAVGGLLAASIRRNIKNLDFGLDMSTRSSARGSNAVATFGDLKSPLASSPDATTAFATSGKM
ncbi:Hypothetical protein, putative, partial [Bodo saltans]